MAPQNTDVIVNFGSVSVDSSFDAEAVIAEFLADQARTCLELPRTLTTQQRKHARQLVEQRADVLRCESFGFGAERQLHLFKKTASTLSEEVEEVAIGESSVSHAARTACMEKPVVSSWIACEDSSHAHVEPIVFGSVLPNLLQPMPRQRATSPACSAGTPSVAASTCAVEDSPAWKNAAESLGACKVRNTFIHFEGENEDLGKREVQSMPHGMFARCLFAEASVQKSLAEVSIGTKDVASDPEERTKPTAPFMDAPSPTENCQFAPGTEVVIEGLVKAPAFNGRSGTVQSFDEDAGRYSISLLLFKGAGWERQLAKVRRENLRAVTPPPQRTCTSTPWFLETFDDLSTSGLHPAFQSSTERARQQCF